MGTQGSFAVLTINFVLANVGYRIGLGRLPDPLAVAIEA